MGCCLEMGDKLEGLEKRDVVENRRHLGQELGIFQLAVPGCSKLNTRPNWAKHDCSTWNGRPFPGQVFARSTWNKSRHRQSRQAHIQLLSTFL
jgi:hypothetical protein